MSRGKFGHSQTAFLPHFKCPMCGKAFARANLSHLVCSRCASRGAIGKRAKKSSAPKSRR